MSATKSDILAVIVNYNAGNWLERCVRALAAGGEVQSIRVIDNASTDDSLEGVGEWEQAGRISVIRNRENVGFGRACNQALAGASEPCYLLVNPDCIVDPGAVGELRRVLTADPNAGIAGALIVDADGREQRACRRRAPTLKRTWNTMLGLERLGREGVNVRGPLPDAPTEVEAVSGALMLVRAACFQAIGGFDEGYFLHCEDLDLFARARAAGWRVLFVPSARARHALGVSQRGRRLAAERHKHAGMVRYFRRHLGPASAWPVRWLWPALIWARYLALAPLWWWRQRRESR